jgi:hypothetical protein
MEDCDRCLVKDNFAALVGKRSQTNESMGKRWHNGMTWPNIIVRGSAETKASMAFATEHSGHPFATVMLTVGARGL